MQRLTSPAWIIAGVTLAAAADTGLADRREWKEIVTTWNEAADIAAGKKGDYPFLNDTTKKWFLDRLKKHEQDCAALVKASVLTRSEGGLVLKGLQDLATGVQRFRSKSMMNATCYEPMLIRPAAVSAEHLKTRLELLAELVAQPTVRPEVLTQTLAAIEKDLTTLADEKSYQYLSEDEKAAAIKTRDAAAKRVEQLKTKLAHGQLERTREWQTITTGWNFCTPLAITGKSTEAQRKEVDAKLAATGKAIIALAAAHKLTDEEAKLLQQEAVKLRADIYRNPPTDCRVTCYLMAWNPPARQSLERINQRLPLLQKNAAALQGDVLDKILPTLEADLKILGDEKELRHLPEAEREKARTLREQAAETIKKIRQYQAVR